MYLRLGEDLRWTKTNFVRLSENQRWRERSRYKSKILRGNLSGETIEYCIEIRYSVEL